MNRIYVAYGDNHKEMAARLIAIMNPAIGLKKDACIVLKPNLVVAKDWRSGATTHPEVCAAVIEYFQSHGQRNICIAESAWVGENTQRAFRICGYEALAERYDIRLIDVKKDRCEARECDGFHTEISRTVLEADVLVNLPLIKGHCQTKVTCALKNMKGIIPDKEKRRYHTLGLHEPIAHLNRMIRPTLTIADGIWTDPGFEEGGNPAIGNVMAAGSDSVLIDAYAAKRLGYRADEIGYIRIAERLGLGSSDLNSAEIVELGGMQTQDAATSGVPKEVTNRIDARGACSACYASLVSALTELGETAEHTIVCVGQNFKGQSGKLGCGDCTAQFEISIKGCPPKQEDIVQFLKTIKERA